MLAVLNVLSSTPPLVKRRAPRTDGLFTHFASPRGEKCSLVDLLGHPRFASDVETGFGGPAFGVQLKHELGGGPSKGKFLLRVRYQIDRPGQGEKLEGHLIALPGDSKEG